MTTDTVVALPGVTHPADAEAKRAEKRAECAAELRALADQLDAGVNLQLVCCSRVDDRMQLLVNCKPPMALALANSAAHAALQRFMGEA
jgi:hypothetical protein